MGINAGFTGTRDGMTTAQKHKLRRILSGFVTTYDEVYFHEGEGLDRRGGNNSADQQAKEIAQKLGCIIVPHAPANGTAEAMLARNRETVAPVQFMIGAPLEHREQVRSGTWMTIRHARAQHKDGVIIWPQCGCDSPLEAREHPVD